MFHLNCHLKIISPKNLPHKNLATFPLTFAHKTPQWSRLSSSSTPMMLKMPHKHNYKRTASLYKFFPTKQLHFIPIFTVNSIYESNATF